jgi:hypothetical protein
MPRRITPFFDGGFYHIYNRGNNRQPIFFERENYLFFPQANTRVFHPRRNRDYRLLPHAQSLSHAYPPAHCRCVGHLSGVHSLVCEIHQQALQKGWFIISRPL